MDVNETMTWLDQWFDRLIEEKAYLSDLDQKIGDGDHGNNMARGAVATKEALKNKQPADVSALFMTVAQTLMSKIGGASGPLYGSAFLAMATTAKNSDNIADIFAAGLDKIQQRGKAEPGEKTMVDIWHPAVEALKANSLNQEVLDEASAKTTELKATKGRASYYGERSIGEPDPGAESSKYLFEALIQANV
ncbi:dihydroxyacetone kinase subunit DhaL [Aerococcus sp. HMSC10H05]|uniref:dihydroxyacetone kinase subunit DhaL n=1 Tax=Aerococcus sp. HMSC10H05 TaxID=1581084 RepID=UPI0008A3A9D1|nr:dihydroxyacetone kinase subunit DhaL [Aerococcus sp. HMSC10H05]OFU49875.1 dihydroxyacetone kinase subunit L [Aerococcus sp. HMSC10H05]